MVSTYANSLKFYMRQEFNAHRIFGAQRWRPCRFFGIPILPTPWIQLKTNESAFQTKLTPEMYQSIPKLLIPLGIPRAFGMERWSLLWGIWPKMRPAQSDIWLSPVSILWSASQAKGFRNSFPIQHMRHFHRLLLLYSLFCWSFENLWKSP